MRTKCSVKRVTVSPFFTTESRPFKFLGYARILVWVERTYKDGRVEKALLEVELLPGYKTDGASTFWPISKLVPQWKKGDDVYNAAPVGHDILYMFQGVVPDISSPNEPVLLSREEVDDILRGTWRIAGMSRFLAGCADKGVEIFAGSSRHWGNDSYGVADKVSLSWTPLSEVA